MSLSLLLILLAWLPACTLGYHVHRIRVEREHRVAIREYAEQIARLNAVTAETEEVYTAKARLN